MRCVASRDEFSVPLVVVATAVVMVVALTVGWVFGEPRDPHLTPQQRVFAFAAR